MRKLFLFLLLTAQVFGQPVNVIVPPSGTLTIQGDVTASQYNDPILSGVSSAESLAYQYIVAIPSDKGTITNGGTLTLDTYSSYTLTNVGDYTISLPATTASGYYLIEGVSTSAVDPVMIILPNETIRLASGVSTLISNLTVRAGSSIRYLIGLSVTNITGAAAGVRYIDAEGDIFAQAVTANQVAFSPSSDFSSGSTNAQLALIDLGQSKLNTNDVSLAGRTGSYSDLTGTPPSSTLLTVYASGTGYNLTTTPAALDFSVQDPVLVISQAGNYRITPTFTIEYVGATCTNQTVIMKLRRTNNTAADINNSTSTFTTETTTTATGTFVTSSGRAVGYTTTNVNDSLTIFGSLSDALSAGSIRIVSAAINVERIEAWSVYDTVAPVVDASSVPASGEQLYIDCSENMAFGAGGSGGFVLNASGGAVTLSSPTILSSFIIYTTSRTIASGETLTLDYVQPGAGAVDLSGNELASFTGTNVVNNSTDPGFTPFTAALDGSNDYMTTGILAGSVDTNKFTFSGWIKATGGDGATKTIYRELSAGRYEIMRTNSNAIRIIGKSSGGTTILDMSTTSSLVVASNWVHLLVAIDLSDAAKRHIYFNGEEQPTNVVVYTSGTMDLLTTGVRVGAGASGLQKWQGEFCEFWLGFGQYTTNVASFAAGGKPISLGSQGELPTTVAPVAYYSLVGDANSWATDSSGNGNNATVTGAFGTGTPP